MKYMELITQSIGSLASFVALFALSASSQAATFSSTKVEVLYGFDYKRGPGFSETNEAILTVANATGFTWGDSFFFLDTTNVDDDASTGGTHFEFGPRYRFWKGDGVIKSVNGIVQADFTSNRFTQKIVKMAGISFDWNVPGFKFVKTHLQYRDDPTLEGSSVQFNLVWNKSFKLGDADFSFEGFLDWTTSEGAGAANLLMQPQLVWHATKHFGMGIEYQYWHNRIGVAGVNEKSPQIMARWTF